MSFIQPYITFFTLAFLANSSAFSQAPNTLNIVPNNGFELYAEYPSGWYYVGADFSRTSLYWTSATGASPDLYGPGADIPTEWIKAGFGRIKPFEGKSCAGITVYGCDSGKLHCREYLQVQLAEPLVPGQRYAFSCMLAHLQKSVAVKNLGIWCSDDEIQESHNKPLTAKPDLLLNQLLPSDGRWHKWTGHFTANTAASYLLIGNFFTDDSSYVKLPTRSSLRFGYYYVDDVQLFKIPPILPVPPEDSPLDNFVPRPGEVVTLSRIYFEHDRTDFMPRARIQLDQLLRFLKKHPTMKVEIIGHTDSVGSDSYNQQLSIRRSAAVIAWLVDKGIDRKRLSSSGFGSSVPIATNATSAGRAQNRRVEIKVISL